MRLAIVAFLSRRPLVTLTLMTLCFLLFGYFSLNLFFLFRANIEFLSQYGLMGWNEGGAEQFGLILLSGLASTFFFTAAKVCENLLVKWMLRD